MFLLLSLLLQSFSLSFSQIIADSNKNILSCAQVWLSDGVVPKKPKNGKKRPYTLVENIIGFIFLINEVIPDNKKPSKNNWIDFNQNVKERFPEFINEFKKCLDGKDYLEIKEKYAEVWGNKIYSKVKIVDK